MRRIPTLLVIAATATVLASASACGGRGKPPAGAPAPRGAAVTTRPASAGPEFDASRLYTQMGFLASGAPMPFVGGVSYLATASPDSTNVYIALSLANAALAFTRDNDRFLGGYTVSLSLRQGGVMVHDLEAHETVRVATFKETGRIDESIVFQQGLTAAPGQYALSVSLRDDGSGRASTQEMLLTVPRLGAARTLSTPVPFLKVVPRRTRAALADLVGNPRSTAIFGRDSLIPFYVEGYGQGDSMAVTLEGRNESGRVLFHDVASLPRRGDLFSGVVNVPVAKVGIGIAVISMWPSGTTDTVRAPVFVGFGDELPVAKFEDMLLYLRWFAAPYRLKVLRDSPPEARPAAWAQFVKETDSTPLTAVNEDLHEYFERLLQVTTRYREEGTPGWMSDRGKVFLGLGEPDQVFDQGMAALGDRGRAQVWEYRRYNFQLTFYDQTGFGRWRLTNASEIEFMSQWQRRVNR
ncbi:MAG: GWxTD domain-containing protein [Gemmatimonadaceae bacterium]